MTRSARDIVPLDGADRHSLGTTLLLTRPQPGADRFAVAFAVRFPATPVVISPLQQIVPVPPAIPPERFGALIFTSVNGVAAFAAQSGWRDAPAFCVGASTAAAAAAAGFVAHSAQGDADALVAMIIARRAAGPLLHLRGADATGDVAERLTAAGIATAATVVYRQDASALTAAAARLLHGHTPVLLPLFSPRAARLFCGAAPAPRAPLLIAAISAAVAAVAPPAARLIVAARPDAPAMLDALGQLDPDATTDDMPHRLADGA